MCEPSSGGGTVKKQREIWVITSTEAHRFREKKNTQKPMRKSRIRVLVFHTTCRFSLSLSRSRTRTQDLLLYHLIWMLVGLLSLSLCLLCCYISRLARSLWVNYNWCLIDRSNFLKQFVLTDVQINNAEVLCSGWFGPVWLPDWRHWETGFGPLICGKLNINIRYFLQLPLPGQCFWWIWN